MPTPTPRPRGAIIKVDIDAFRKRKAANGGVNPISVVHPHVPGK